MDNFCMSSRETVIEFVSKLPEEMSLAEISREIELLAGVQTPRQQSGRLGKEKDEAVSRLESLADEYNTDGKITVQPCVVLTAESFLRVLPEGVSLPEFSVEPDGSISLDWIESRHRLFSLSVGQNNRFAYAWLDGTNKGHGVEDFDGQQIPKRIMDGITAIVNHGNASFRTA
jgi:hypothetical protein